MCNVFLHQFGVLTSYKLRHFKLTGIKLTTLQPQMNDLTLVIFTTLS